DTGPIVTFEVVNDPVSIQVDLTTAPYPFLAFHDTPDMQDARNRARAIPSRGLEQAIRDCINTMDQHWTRGCRLANALVSRQPTPVRFIFRPEITDLLGQE